MCTIGCNGLDRSQQGKKAVISSQNFQVSIFKLAKEGHGGGFVPEYLSRATSPKACYCSQNRGLPGTAGAYH